MIELEAGGQANRQAGHVEEEYQDRGLSMCRACATLNKSHNL
jgi:hypothetical protein